MHSFNKTSNRCYFSQLDQATNNDSKKKETCYHYNQQDSCITFLSSSGNQYILPLDTNIRSIRALPEGLLIGWGQQNEFNYSVITDHPMGHLSPLGILNKNGENDKWLESNEQIIYTNRYLPIVVSYNHQYSRHSVYLLKRNTSYINKTFLSQQYFPSTLNQQSESSVIGELFYEESTKENVVRKCKIIKGSSEQDFIICMLYSSNDNGASYLKLLSCNFSSLLNSQSSIEVYSALKVVQVLHNVHSITGFNIFRHQKSQVISVVQENLKKQGLMTIYNLIKVCQNYLKDSLVVYHNNKKFTIVFGNKVIMSYSLNIPVLRDTEFQRSIRSINGLLIMQSNNVVYEINCFSQISDQLLITVLRAISLVIDPQQFCILLRDVVSNCLNLEQDSIEPDDNSQSCILENDQFKKFSYYLIFMLKLCGGTRVISLDDQPHKKVKPSMEVNKKNTVPPNKAYETMMNLNHKPATSSQHQQDVFPQRENQKFLLPKFDMTLTMFTLIQERLFYALHLLIQNQELMGQIDHKLLYLAYSFALNMDSELSENYLDYYLRKDSRLTQIYKDDMMISMIPTLRPSTQLSPTSIKTENILDKIPLDIKTWAFNLYSQNGSMFPILYKTTKQVCLVFQQLMCGRQGLWQLPKFLSDQHKPSPNHRVSTFELFVYQRKTTKNRFQGTIDNDNLAFMTLIEKKWDMEYVERLPIVFKVPIMELFSRLRRRPEFLTQVIGKQACLLLNRLDCYKNWKLYGQSQKTKKQFKNYVDQTIRGQKGGGTEDNEESHTGIQLSYHDESTISDVLRMFEFQRDLIIKPKLTEHIPDDKLEQEGQVVLQKLLNRRVSVFVGLGALQYGNSEHFITEQVRYPGINMAGLVVQNGLKLQFDQARDEHLNYQQWPEFHLGVSLALQLSRKLKGLSHESLRTWIFYQKPSQPTNVCGGFMYGLGLLGYLDALNQIDIYHLLTMNLNQQMSHECTQVGVLLGIGASRLGRCDESTQKSLSVHIPSLIPSVLDLELPPNVPTSALCSLGLLFLGSGNRNFSEVALGLIGRKPINDKVVDREGYSLAAGVTLGLINLGKGSVWKREMQVEERLIRFVQGGTVLPPPQSTLSTTFNQTEGNISSIKEGNMVNIHVTCPGALMALGLMFLQSNNRGVVQQLSIPENFSELESCNPNHMLLKALTRNLIMWDSIPTTRDEIYNQVPELIRFLFEQPLKRINQKYYLVYNTEVIDFISVAQIYTSVVAGCLLSLGVKFAGTHDLEIKSLILQEIECLQRFKIAQNELANDPENKNSVEQYTYFTNIVNGVMAAALVMAGSFDHDVLLVCRRLKKRLEALAIWHFGFHQALSMAIGLLHLGRGAFSFSKTMQSVALLVLSVYPYYPSHPSDNKQYLQALRWTFVMSIKPKIFKTVDVSTNQMVSVKYQTKNLDHQRQINSVQIQDENFFQFTLTLQDQKKSIQLVYVQKHTLNSNINDLLYEEIFTSQTIINSLKLCIKNLQDESQLDHVMGVLDSNLKDLKEWHLIKQLLKSTSNNTRLHLQWFLMLLRDDELQFIPILGHLIQTKDYKLLHTLEILYTNQQNQSVMSLKQIQTLRSSFNSLTLKQENVKNYIKQHLIPEDHQKFYNDLNGLPVPALADIKMIRQFMHQLPKQDTSRQLTEFYLQRTYRDSNLTQMILNILFQ